MEPAFKYGSFTLHQCFADCVPRAFQGRFGVVMERNRRHPGISRWQCLSFQELDCFPPGSSSQYANLHYPVSRRPVPSCLLSLVCIHLLNHIQIYQDISFPHSDAVLCPMVLLPGVSP